MNTDTAQKFTQTNNKPAVPFFAQDEASSSTVSAVTTDSSFASMWQKSSFSFASRKTSLETRNMKAYMIAWAQFKPSLRKDCLPYDSALTSNNPFLALSNYDLLCHTSYSNLIAILTNSVRREMADMWVYILPSTTDSSQSEIAREICNDMKGWWTGFSQYLFVVLITTSRVLDTVHKSAEVDVAKLDKLKRRDVKREYDRCLERLRVTSEIPMKAMQKRVASFIDSRSLEALAELEQMWCCLANFILQTLDDSYTVAKTIEKYSKKSMPEELQERLLRSMLTPPRFLHSSQGADFEANILVALTRWLQNDVAVMQFISKYFKKRIVFKMDEYFVRYATTRNITKFQFDRKPKSAPRKAVYRPSKVTFSFPT